MATLKKHLSHGNPNERASGAASPLRTSAAARSACLPNILKKRGQQAIEYAVIIAAISAALTVMYAYAKRGIQAHIHEVTIREIGDQIDSAPLADVNENVTSMSVMDSYASDTSRSEVLLGGGTRTTYDANSTSSGVATTDQVEL